MTQVTWMMRQSDWKTILFLFGIALLFGTTLIAETSGSEDNAGDSANDGAAYIGDPAAIESGRQLYGNTCLFCHGAKGVGARAPTLVAGAWAPGRGNTEEYMYQVVMEGRPGTIMGSFKEMLQPQEVWQIAAYLRDQADTLAANK
jgi:mono/diheme cytochrome c family protein